MNINVTGPGAALALGLMFMKTNNTYVYFILHFTLLGDTCESLEELEQPYTHLPFFHVSFFFFVLPNCHSFSHNFI